MHFRSKFGDSSLNHWWVMGWTSSKWGKIWPWRSWSITPKNNRNLFNQGLLHLCSKFGDSSLMTLVPVQKLCVNIYVYIYMYIPYTSSVVGRIYKGSVIQYWRSCTPSRSIGECAVPGLNAILCFLWFTNCVLLFDNNLILGCLWHWVFV